MSSAIRLLLAHTEPTAISEQLAQLSNELLDSAKLLRCAAERGCFQVLVALLLNERVKESTINQVSRDGWTILHSAVYGGQAKIVSLILNCPRVSDLTINAVTAERRTALHLAVIADHLEIVKLLLNSPRLTLATINYRDDQQLSALELAVWSKLAAGSKIVELMLTNQPEAHLFVLQFEPVDSSFGHNSAVCACLERYQADLDALTKAA